MSKTSIRSHAIYFTEPSLTRGSFKAECDVNNIVQQYARTGLVNHVAKATPHYGDAPDIDFTTAALAQAAIASHEAELELTPPEVPPEETEPPVASEEPKTAPTTAEAAPKESPEDGD